MMYSHFNFRQLNINDLSPFTQKQKYILQFLISLSSLTARGWVASATE